MLNNYRFETIPGLPELFVLKRNNRPLHMIVAKVVDDFLLDGLPSEISRFHRTIANRFQVGRFTKGTVLVFNRQHITQKSNGDIEISMEEYMGTISKLDIARERSKQQDQFATTEEITDFLGLAGKLNFLSHGCLPTAAFAASHLQQKRET